MPPRKLARGLFLSLAAGALLSAGSSPLFYDLMHSLTDKTEQIANAWVRVTIAKAEDWAKEQASIIVQELGEYVHDYLE